MSARPARQTGDGLVAVLLIVAFAYGIAHAGEPAPRQARPRAAAAATTTVLGPSTPAPAGLSFTDTHGCSPSGDWRSPRLDRRVRQLLVAAAARHRIRVSCLRTGHSWFVAGTTRVSNHSVWRGVDVDLVDGAPVSPANTAARELARWLGRGGAGVRPRELGSPWGKRDFGPGPWFTNEAHQGHIHVGFAGPTQGGDGR